ncbi:MAG: 5'-nucleotidase C-terminal domain-containing protein [Spirochaetaceae bacterium]|nr:5'-nucleotidase C-terminal domain-containing protein [Spirochaetaceae bacterium]
MNIKKFLSFFVATMLLVTIGCASLPEIPETTLAIAHTNDTHARVLEGKYDGMGFAKIATKVKTLREDNPNFLLLDAGDTFHGTTFATLSEGETITKLVNMLGYDAIAAGNHDFNYGYKRLLELNEMTDAPIVAANVLGEDGKAIFAPYIIKDVNGLLVGIFGLSTPETLTKTHPKNVEGLTFAEPVDYAKMMVKELEGKVHIIIALAHLGVDEETPEMWRSTTVAREVDGLDLIIDGHSHTALDEGVLVGDTLVVQTGYHDMNLGVVNITYKDGVVTAKADLFTKEEAADLSEDAGVMALIGEIEEANKTLTDVVVGHTDVALDGERANVRTGSTNLGVLITDALLDVTGAQISLQNGGGIRTSIDVGPVTKGEIISVLPFGNTVVVKEISGAQVIEAIENGIAAYPAASGAYCHMGGLTFSFDETQPAGSRVTEVVMADGSLIDPAAMYSVATNDFTAAGGDNYTMFKDAKTLAEFGTLDDIVVAFMNK